MCSRIAIILLSRDVTVLCNAENIFQNRCLCNACCKETSLGLGKLDTLLLGDMQSRCLYKDSFNKYSK